MVVSGMTEVIPFESAHSLSDLSYFEEVIELSSGDEVLLTEKSTVKKEPRLPPQSSQSKRKDGFHKSFSEESVDFIEVECSDDEYMIEEVVDADQEEEFFEEFVDDDEDEWHSQLAGGSDEERAREPSNHNGQENSTRSASHRSSKLKSSQHPSEADDESSLGDSCGSFNDSSTAFNPDDPRPPIPTQEELFQKCPSFQTLSDSSLDAQEAFELQLPQSAHRRKSRQMSALTCDWDTLRDELDDMQDYASSVEESRRSLGEDGSHSGRDYGEKSPSLLGKNGVVITMDKRLLSGSGSSGHKRGPLGRTHSGGLRRTSPHPLGVPGGAGGPSDLGTLKEGREDASQGGDFSTVHEADTSGGNANSLRVPMLPPGESTLPPKQEPEKEEPRVVPVGTNGKAISTNNKYDYDDFSDASTSDSVDDDEGFLPESVRATTKIQSFAPMVRKETNDSLLPSRLLHSPDSKLSSVSYHESNTGASLLPPIGRRPRRSSLDNIGMYEGLRPLSPHSSNHASLTDSVDSPKSVSSRFGGSNHSAPEPRIPGTSSPRVRLRSKRRMSTGYRHSLSSHVGSSTGIAIGSKEQQQLRLQPQALDINSSSQPSLKAHRRKLSRFGDLLQRSSALET
eukprot:Nitzschia sp. Nitz4//scaffold110_size71422//20467//22335//NITZ4_005867-RA/size71422-processed-gene-0.3-mRNA-1//1//CDS//3329533068//8923//frame0